MRSVLLLGRDHAEIGYVALEAEACLALAISRGGAQKTYRYHDPNEDAALFAYGPGGALLAVADAHDGSVSAEIALGCLLGNPAAQWVGEDAIDPERWPRHVLAALLDANSTILREIQGTETPLSCTTLSLVVVRPADRQVLYATIGDSHVFLVGAGKAVDRGVRASQELRAELGSFFLGWGVEDEASLESKTSIGCEPLEGLSAVVVATDGLSERHLGVDDPEATVAASASEAGKADPELRPLHLARHLTDVVLATHRKRAAGDNIAFAVAWLGEAGA